MTKPQNLLQVRNLLVDLYPDLESARRIIEEAGLNPATIQFSGSLVHTWHNILQEAERYDKLKELLFLVSAEYPNNATLLKLLNTFNQNKSQ